MAPNFFLLPYRIVQFLHSNYKENILVFQEIEGTHIESEKQNIDK